MPAITEWMAEAAEAAEKERAKVLDLEKPARALPRWVLPAGLGVVVLGILYFAFRR